MSDAAPPGTPTGAKTKGGEGAYVWARLRGGTFPPTTMRKFGVSRKASSNVASKKRGAPTGNGNGTWGWAPGYYSIATAVASGEKRDDAATQYRFTLLIPVDDGVGGSKRFEHSLPESAALKLLESGDVVLANPWEGLDFANRLRLDVGPGGGVSDAKISPDTDAAGESPPSDLIELTHLHEPSVVHALRYRAERASRGVDMSRIYTDTGPILLAVNPFKRDATGRLYGDETVKKYREEGEARWIESQGGVTLEAKEGGEATGNGTRQLPPHVYKVADRVFRAMMDRLDPSSDDNAGGRKANQSVLCSGESGAGKTVTAKMLMAYLSKLSEASGDAGSNGNDDMPIEQRILESNPVVESFGNARTVRNDNSSRFGKYIEMKFMSDGSGMASDESDVIPGATLFSASIETYLLEKVRLVHQSPGERNYHIFYELFSMKGDTDSDAQELVEEIGLREYSVADFRLINSSGTYDRRDGVADADTFRDLKHAMSVMGFNPSEVRAVLGVTAALLHASNLKFAERAGGDACEVADDPHRQHFARLLGIADADADADDGAMLNGALCYQTICAAGRSSTYKKVLTLEQCERGVEALIKATYGAMFEYLVRRINASIAGDGGGNAGVVGGGARKASVGILDIFGFESFENNSFEQLCINYCNESLQQQFNGFVLRNEQEEYDREGIPWSYIEFPENQDVLDLIDAKGSGILHILQDMSRAPGASDKTFAQAMYSRCKTNRRFEADSRQMGQQLFAVHHYAGLVEYDVEGFVEKTKDELPQSGIDLLLRSTNTLVKSLAEILRPPAPPAAAAQRGRRGGAAKRPTVGIQFSSQLQSLRKKIDDTSPHYVRCLKPNNLLVPNRFDAALIADQLRCAGIIEAVRVSRLGYPQRFSHDQFISRYRTLGKGLERNISANTLLDSIKLHLNDPPDFIIQVGRTKVFMRRQAYDLLEKMRGEEVTTAAVIIQKYARKFVSRIKFVKTVQHLITAQSFVRKVLAVKKMKIRREHLSSTINQRSWRRYVARKRFISAKVIARWVQSHQRGSLGRKRYNELNCERKALYLQSCWRGYREMTSYKKKTSAVLVIQCAKRCHSARALVRARRAEAQDFSAVVQERDRLRRELITLQDELHKTNGNSAELNEKETEIQSLCATMDQLSKDKDYAASELEKVNNELNMLEAERDLVADDRDQMEQVNVALQRDMNSREEAMQTMRKDMEVSNLKINALEGEHVAVAAQLAEVEGKFQEAMDSNMQLSDQLASLQNAHNDASTHLTEKQAALDDAESTILSLKEEASRLSHKIAQPYNANKAAEERATALKGSLQSEQVAAVAKLAEIEGELTSLKGEHEVTVMSLTEKETALEKALAVIAIQREESLAKISELQTANTAAEERITALEGKLQAEEEAATMNPTALEVKLNETTDHVESLKNINDETSKSLTEKEASLDNAESTILSLKEEASQLSDKIAQLHNANTKLLAEKEASLDDAKSTISSLEEELQKAKTAVEERVTASEFNLQSEQVAAAVMPAKVEAELTSLKDKNEAMARILAEKELALEHAQALAVTHQEDSLTKISELQKAMVAAEEQTTVRGGKLQAEEEATAAKLTAVGGNLSLTTRPVESLQNGDHASKLVSEKEAPLDDTESTILSLKEEASRLSDQVVQLRSAKMAVEERATALECALQSEQTEIQTLRATLGQLSHELSMLKAENNIDVDTVFGTKDDTEVNVNDFSQNGGPASKLLSEHSKSINDAKSTISSSKEDVSRVKAQGVSAVAQELDVSRKEVIALQNELQKTKDESAKLIEKETETKTLRANLGQLSSELDKVNKELNMLKSERNIVAKTMLGAKDNAEVNSNTRQQAVADVVFGTKDYAEVSGDTQRRASNLELPEAERSTEVNSEPVTETRINLEEVQQSSFRNLASFFLPRFCCSQKGTDETTHWTSH